MATEENLTRRIAAIDVGTNTVMCLVADVYPDGRLEVLADEERFARLGAGVDETGRLTEDAMDRVLARLAECKSTAERFNVETIVIGATSASRDAANTDELIRRVNDELGLDYRVLSGEEEAELSFRGALAMVPGMSEACVLDVGGGSTEIIAGEVGEIRYQISLDIGSVRLSERFFSSQPPSTREIQQAEREVRAVLDTIPHDTLNGLPLIEGGGTARVLTSLTGADQHSPDIPWHVVREWRDLLLAMSGDEIRALNPSIFTGREDIAGAALLILESVMRCFGYMTFIAGEGGLRHGLALQSVEW